LRLAGHKVVGFDFNQDAVAKLTAAGSVGVHSLEELVKNLQAPRAVWMMVPAGDPVDHTIAQLEEFMQPGDAFIDGGNSNYKDTQRRHTAAVGKGLDYIDCGTSGGIWGLKEGYSLMIGGDEAPIKRLTPIFEALAPSPDKGWGRTGPSGAGHFVKMVHNGIEYGLMQAYAEGFSIMKAKAPLALDLTQISEIWRYGSVVRSWLLDLTASAEQEPDARRSGGLCGGFGRGAMDGDGGDRPEYLGAGDHRVADSQAAFARREQLYRSHDLDHAQ
jgi:6-phosphogluconate dehydrogenase